MGHIFMWKYPFYKSYVQNIILTQIKSSRDSQTVQKSAWVQSSLPTKPQKSSLDHVSTFNLSSFSEKSYEKRKKGEALSLSLNQAKLPSCDLFLELMLCSEWRRFLVHFFIMKKIGKFLHMKLHFVNRLLALISPPVKSSISSY